MHERLIPPLRTMIDQGELPPGSVISEAALCGHFGVSRTPLREALKVLAADGLVELRPHRAPRVSNVDPAEIAAVFEVLTPLEQLAGSLACRRATEDCLARLATLHEALLASHAARDRAGYFRLNQQLHRRIVELAGNPVLASTHAALWSRLTRARAMANMDSERWDASTEEHAELVAALRARDAARAGECLAEHSRRTAEAVLSRLRSVEMPPDPKRT